VNDAIHVQVEVVDFVRVGAQPVRDALVHLPVREGTKTRGLRTLGETN
jgi:hypothetical protein